MPIMRMGPFQLQADGTEAAVLVGATALLAQNLDASPPGLELRRLEPHQQTWLFAMPAATLVVHGVDEAIGVQAREAGGVVEALELARGDSYVAPPGTIVQLRNDGELPRVVLLVTSPGRLREFEGKRVTHDDTVVVGRAWDGLTLEVEAGELAAQRAEVLRRLVARRGLAPRCEDRVITSTPGRPDPARPCSVTRTLVEGAHAAMAHHELAPGHATSPVRHRTVEQLWHVVSGRGELWRLLDGEARVDALGPGDSVRLGPGVPFQLRAVEAALCAVVTTTPRWPGTSEAVQVRGHW